LNLKTIIKADPLLQTTSRKTCKQIQLKLQSMKEVVVSRFFIEKAVQVAMVFDSEKNFL